MEGPDRNGVNFSNLEPRPFTCGPATPSPSSAGAPAPECAFELVQGYDGGIIPIEKVVLTAPDAFDTGAVVEWGLGRPLLIDLTESNSRSVTYAGWSWSPPDAAWARIVVEGEFLLSLVKRNG